MSKKLLLYVNTVKYLRLKQIVGQMKKPFVMKAIPAVSEYNGSINISLRTAISILDLNGEYLNQFNVEQLLNNEFTLLNETHTIDINTWESEASPLWRFNLHYFEYAIALAARYSNTQDCRHYDKFKELVQAWISANPVGYGDAWHPYTISMRIPNWCICFDLFGDVFWQDESFCNEISQNIYKQYKILLKRQETWQLGNHYFENLKTIMLCSLLFNEQSAFDKYVKRFLKEVKEEILPDGVHFELSMMYHKVILDDVLRVAYWLKQANKPQYKELLLVIQRMTNAVASLEKGMGKTPLFNDAGDGIAKTSESLIAAACELFGIIPVLSDEFTASGYYKLYEDDIAVMFDAGEIGPSYMPGHGHCDCLSFELSVDREPLFVNSGTYQYQGEQRKYFRSTMAHNTLTIGNKEQSECWGEHRVARRLSDIYSDKEGRTLIGSFKSYSGNDHIRRITLRDRRLTVLDLIKTQEQDVVRSYLHLAPAYECVNHTDCICVMSGDKKICDIHADACEMIIHTDGVYSEQFGKLESVSVIEFTWLSDNEQHGYSIDFK